MNYKWSKRTEKTHTQKAEICKKSGTNSLSSPWKLVQEDWRGESRLTNWLYPMVEVRRLKETREERPPGRYICSLGEHFK